VLGKISHLWVVLGVEALLVFLRTRSVFVCIASCLSVWHEPTVFPHAAPRSGNGCVSLVSGVIYVHRQDTLIPMMMDSRYPVDTLWLILEEDYRFFPEDQDP
jgi:hypothetical protein